MKLPEKTYIYFLDNIYEKTRERYNSTKTDILQLMLTTTTQEPVPKLELSEEDASVKTKELLEEQECNFNALNHTISKINSDDTSTLKTKWEKIDNLHWKLQKQMKGSNGEYDRYYNLTKKYEI